MRTWLLGSGLALALAVVGCRPYRTTVRTEDPVPRPAVPHVAVVAFALARAPDSGGAVIPPALGAAVARRMAVHLASHGVRVVDPEVVLRASVEDGRQDQPTRAIRIARQVGASRVVFGTVTRYQERGDTAGAGEQPASVAYQALLVRALDGVVLATDRFDSTSAATGEAGAPLSRLLRGGRPVGRDQLLDGALGETAARFAAAMKRSR
jgi:hypothetical protein